MARVAGFNPYTLVWNMEDNPVRMVVTGEIEGFNISFNFYDSDFNSYNEDGELNGLSMYEVGVIQVLTSELLRHGVLPVRRGSSQGAAAPSASAPVKKWECPEHGASSVYPAKFGKGLQCNRWIEASQGQQSWTKGKEAIVNGQARFYCRHREFDS